MPDVVIDQAMMEAAGLPPPTLGQYTRLKGVSTTTAATSAEQIENIKANIKHGLPMLSTLSEFNKVKGFSKEIAIVGGGPSLENNLEELKKFRTIMVAGSAHDYLIGKGIIPTYASNCDPDAISANYFTKPDTEVKYLIATNSSPKVLEVLAGKQIILWHCHSTELYEEVQKHLSEIGIEEYIGVGGGCTVGLRSISLALMLGYANMHLFGFDSCMGGEEGDIHHAYDWADPEEAKLINQVYKIKLGPVGGPEGKEYYVAGYQLAQIENFKDFYLKHHEYFMPTFHGGGALSDMFDMLKREYSV